MFLKEELKYLIACAIVAVGVGSGLFVGGVWGACWPIAAFAALLTALSGYGLMKKTLGWTALFFAALAVSLFSRCKSREQLDRMTEIGASRPSFARLRVNGESAVRAGKDGTRWISFPSSIAGVKVKAVLPLENRVPVPGEIWDCKGWLSCEDSFGRRRFFVKGQGTYAMYSELDFPGWIIKESYLLRGRMSKMLEKGVSRSSRGLRLCKTMILGERRTLSRKERDIFVNAGTIHVFAVSGLHVMIISGILLLFPRLLFVPMRFAGLILIPLLFLYVAIVGFPASAIRAFAMISFYHMAPLFWRRPNAIVAWALAFLTLSLCSPAILLNAGAWFSFMVTFALLAWTRIAAGGATSSCVETLGVTLSTWLAGVPIAAFVFGKVSFGGLVANLLVVPLATFAVGSGLIGILFGGISIHIASHFNNFSAMIADFMFIVSSAVSSFLPVWDKAGSWSLWLCIAWYAVMFAAAVRLYRRLRRKPAGFVASDFF